MFGYFPTLYQDEIAYSIIARLNWHLRFVSTQVFVEMIYGRKSLNTAVDLPNRILELFKNTPLSTFCTPEEFVERHTLYNFYSFGLNEKQKSVLMNNMLSYEKKSYHSQGLYNPVCQDKELRFCPICMKIDIDAQGEPYWHAIHQAPGVMICPYHRVYLLERCSICGAAFQGRLNECIPLRDKCPNGHELLDQAIRCRNDLTDKFHNYAFWALIVSNNQKTYEKEYIYSLIRRKIEYSGKARVNGRISIKQIAEEFVSYYGIPFLKIMESNINLEDDSNWFYRFFFRSHKTALVHPVRIILVMNYFFDSPMNIDDNLIKHPFGEGPWPCLNPAADHYRQSIINECNISLIKKKEILTGKFVCKCGFEYIRIGPQKSESERYTRYRAIKRGKVWEDKLQKLLASGKHTIYEIANLLEVDAKTIHRHLKKDIRKERKVHLDEVKLFEAKNIIIEGINKYPNYSRTKIRDMYLKQYSYINRWEKSWLNKNLPEPSIRKRFSWEDLDQLYRDMLPSIIDQIKAKEKPCQITKSNIIDYVEIPKRYQPTKSLMKILPLFFCAIQSAVEPIDEYHIRGINWAYRTLKAANEPITEKQIKKMFYIKKAFSKPVQDYLHSLLKS
ncbi:hypothetical protein SPFL3102_02840 [Sporomusaceae bacterium FL31]|nr:hypothetical protein SPFL3101_01170 [Sporomusaceae bacterium FL31]GCE35012.1 hypothetical protein SPFL3102_02840 [Sporomusaceae bacterium]